MTIELLNSPDLKVKERNIIRFERLREKFEKKTKGQRIICDTNIFLPPLFYFEDDLKGLFDIFSDPEIDKYFFSEASEDVRYVQDYRLKFDSYLASKPNISISKEVLAEIIYIKNRCNKNKKKNKNNFYFKAMAESDNATVSRLEKIIDIINDDGRIVSNNNQQIKNILDKGLRGTNYKLISETDKSLVAYLPLGYCVFSNDKHIRDLARILYKKGMITLANSKIGFIDFHGEDVKYL